MKKRTLTALLALVMLLSAFPVTAAAFTALEVSDACVEFVKTHEGFSAEAYADGGSWYIGYGCACGKDDYPDGISEEEAEALLREKMEAFDPYVNAFLKKYDISVTQNQFDALLSMTYAFGQSWLDTANRLPSYLANGIENYSDSQVINAFAAWCHIGGQANEALIGRRIAEAKMFLYGDYSYDISDWSYLILSTGGGSVESDVVCFERGVEYGELPVSERKGYIFSGWLTDSGELLSADDTVDDSRRVSAVWSVQEAPVTPSEETPGTDAGETPGTDAGTVQNPAQTSFEDVLSGAWFYSYVTELCTRGVIAGFGDGTFRPDESVSYGQALKLVLLSAGYKEQTAEENTHWASGYLKFAETKGFIKKDAITDLDAVITRSEIADLAAAALVLDTSSTANNPFYDTSRGSVLALNRIGIVEGSVENGQRLYKGDNAITRAEFSAIVWRVADYVDREVILFNNYRIPVNHEIAANPYNPDDFYTEDGRVYYAGAGYDVHYGIDVSYYQNDIDWEKVRDDGVDYAIIRAGYRGCSEGVIFEDTRFREYIEGALDAGIKVGLYFFSQAINPEEAREEADYVLSLASEYDISYPIAFDWEPLNYSYSRTKDFDYSVLTDCAIAFCDEIEAAGYTPVVYLNETFAYLRYDISRLTDYYIWLAHYTENTDYRYDFKIWQYGSSGNVDGIAGRVDMDISFMDFSK